MPKEIIMLKDGRRKPNSKSHRSSHTGDVIDERFEQMKEAEQMLQDNQ